MAPRSTSGHNKHAVLVVLVLLVVAVWLGIKPTETARRSGDAKDADVKARRTHHARGTNVAPLHQLRHQRQLGHFSTSPRSYYKGEYGWVFHRYVSSDLEIRFREDVKSFRRESSWSALIKLYSTNVSTLFALQKGRVVPNKAFYAREAQTSECEVYRFDAQQTASVDQSVASRTCLGDMSEMDATVFSRFEYEFVCLEPPCTKLLPSGRALGEIHTSYIEPLFGYLRHPQVFLNDGLGSGKTNKEYMIVDKWALNHLYTRWQRRSRHSFFFDMGASTYTSGLGGASQNWFVGLGDCMCTPFTEMRLWEATTTPVDAVWKMYEPLLPHYFWYNYPLSADVDSWRNPLNHLVHRVPPNGEAPVVMKVDFDSFVAERQIIDTVVETPELYQLIDELFFEHHVVLGRMEHHWYTSMDRNSTVVESIDLFLSMRRLGIRAHSWV